MTEIEEDLPAFIFSSVDLITHIYLILFINLLNSSYYYSSIICISTTEGDSELLLLLNML